MSKTKKWLIEIRERTLRVVNVECCKTCAHSDAKSENVMMCYVADVGVKPSIALKQWNNHCELYEAKERT